MERSTKQNFLQPVLEKGFDGMPEVRQNLFNPAMQTGRAVRMLDRGFAKWRNRSLKDPVKCLLPRVRCVKAPTDGKWLNFQIGS